MAKLDHISTGLACKVSCSIDHVMGGGGVPKMRKNCKKVSKFINLIPFGVFVFEWVSVDKTTVFANVQLFKNKHARVR